YPGRARSIHAHLDLHRFVIFLRCWVFLCLLGLAGRRTADYPDRRDDHDRAHHRRERYRQGARGRRSIRAPVRAAGARKRAVEREPRRPAARRPPQHRAHQAGRLGHPAPNGHRRPERVTVTGRRLAAGLLAAFVVFGTVDVAWSQPSEADVFVAEGILALEDKKYDEALASFQRALQRERGHVEALYYAGVTLMAQNKAAEAAPLLERARRISPEEMSVAYQLGLAYFGLNRYDEAQVVLESVFRRDPTLDS